MNFSWTIRALAGALLMLGLAGVPGEAARLGAAPDWRATFAQLGHRERFEATLAPLAAIQQAPAAARPVLLRQALLANEGRIRAFPTDGTAWLIHAWLTAQSSQPVAAALPALALSYRLAPHEMALMMERVPFSLALWPVLPESLRQAVLVEVRLMAEPYRSTQVIMRLAEVAAALGPLTASLVSAEAHGVSDHSGRYFDALVASYRRP